MAAGYAAAQAVIKAISPSKRKREEEQQSRAPPAKKPARVLKCNACLLSLRVVRLKREHDDLPNKCCPAASTDVKQLQQDAHKAMGWSGSREFSSTDFVTWWIQQKGKQPAAEVPGPVKQLSYTSMAYSEELGLGKVKDLKKAKEKGWIEVQE